MARKMTKPDLNTADSALKEVFMTLSQGRRPLKIWTFFANITNKFILGLDILRAYNTSMDLGRQMLHLVEEELSLWSSGMRPWPFTW
jgi:hypothetical protein